MFMNPSIDLSSHPKQTIWLVAPAMRSLPRMSIRLMWMFTDSSQVIGLQDPNLVLSELP